MIAVVPSGSRLDLFSRDYEGAPVRHPAYAVETLYGWAVLRMEGRHVRYQQRVADRSAAALRLSQIGRGL